MRVQPSNQNPPCIARRAGIHDFLTGLASFDAGDFAVPNMRGEVVERGLPA